MRKMFLMNRASWIDAALDHFSVWRRKEQAIFSKMTPRISTEGISEAGGYYRVARHFPSEGRSNLAVLIDQVVFRDGSVQDRFDEFVRSVRTVTDRVTQKRNLCRRNLRPISGISKFLWYRLPLHGFIYDSQVLAAICKNGLTVRFDTLIDAFGGKPSDAHEWNFMIAAAAYRTFALPLHQVVAEVFRAHDLQPERSARLIDMLFWTEGNPKLPVRDLRDISERKLASHLGDEAFERCKDIIAAAVASSQSFPGMSASEVV